MVFVSSPAVTKGVSALIQQTYANGAFMDKYD